MVIFEWVGGVSGLGEQPKEQRKGKEIERKSGALILAKSKHKASENPEYYHESLIINH